MFKDLSAHVPHHNCGELCDPPNKHVLKVNIREEQRVWTDEECRQHLEATLLEYFGREYFVAEVTDISDPQTPLPRWRTFKVVVALNT